MTIKEEFRAIKGYPDYEVSNLGRVKSLERIGHAGSSIDEKILKTNPDANHYPTVTLWKDGKGTSKNVHILMGIEFLDYNTGIDGWSVNHKDYNRENNNLSNLEIGMPRDIYCMKHLQKSDKYEDVYLDKIFSNWKTVVTRTKNDKRIEGFKDELEASEAQENWNKKASKWGLD
jgi:hypothetical protein